MISLKLKESTLEVLRDLVQSGAKDECRESFDGTRDFLEVLISRFIYDSLESKCHRQVIRSGMTHEQVCKVFMDYRKADRGEPGYKLHVNPKIGKVIAIATPNSEKDI